MPSDRPRLNAAERAFLRESNIPQEYVADMRHRAEWARCSDELRVIGCYFAWGFRKCGAGHRLSNGRGRCIECHPSTIGFVMRHTRCGWLYIAAAEGELLTKVGVAADVSARLNQLNAHRLAGVRSWRVIHTEWCENPAALEAKLHSRLAQHRVDASYEHKGGQVGREVFACFPDQAIDALAQIYSERADW